MSTGAQYLDLPALQGKGAGKDRAQARTHCRELSGLQRRAFGFTHFTRGPALFYNRWQLKNPPLPFAEMPPDWQIAPPPAR